MVSTLAGGTTQGYVDGDVSIAQFLLPSGIAVVGDGTILVSDWSGIRKISLGSRKVSTLVGGDTAGLADGVGKDALFQHPSGIALDKAGSIYVADAYNHAIRKIDQSGRVSTLSGGKGHGYVDGDTSDASFGGPSGLLIVPGALIVSEYGNDAVRRIQLEGLMPQSLEKSDAFMIVDGKGKREKTDL